MINKVFIAIVLLIMLVISVIIYYEQNYNPYFNSNTHLQVPPS